MRRKGLRVAIGAPSRGRGPCLAQKTEPHRCDPAPRSHGRVVIARVSALAREANMAADIADIRKCHEPLVHRSEWHPYLITPCREAEPGVGIAMPMVFELTTSQMSDFRH